ncbi:SLC17A5 [Cordylochernes scorpioides]|uniref:SLC17A5 n=1 Tax=Cordylochernes scorpioides TaxID=51811 RepID=A0ABY6K0F4_9ARAC|nr:SLC17A5 [Cordylochernes scorpioides]
MCQPEIAVYRGGRRGRGSVNLCKKAILLNACIIYIQSVAKLQMAVIQGVNSASMYAMFARWAPPQERSRLLSICTIGQHVGTIVAMPLVGYLCEAPGLGWKMAFYVFGVAGVAWFVLWAALVHNSPAEHPRISRSELLYITQNQAGSRSSRAIPWKHILTSLPVWAVTTAKFAGTWGFTCLLTKLPAYLADVLNLSIQKNGMINALVYTAEIAVMLLSGYVSDWLRKKRYLSTTSIRKIFESIALLGPAVCLSLVPAAGCQNVMVVTLLVLSMGLYGCIGGGDVPDFVDIAPEFAGTIFGFANGLAGTTGFLSPLMAGIFLDSDHGGLLQWSKVFYVTCAIYAMGALVFLLFGSGEIQPWALDPKPPLKEKPILEVVTLSASKLEELKPDHSKQ